MIYKCPHAVRRPGKLFLFCKKRNKDCVNQRFCSIRRETVLTQFAKDCPARREDTLTIAPVTEPAPAQKQKQKATAKKAKVKQETETE